jgi:hypothetical protein
MLMLVEEVVGEHIPDDMFPVEQQSSAGYVL